MQSLWARGPQHCPSFTEFNENIPQRQYLLLVERLWQINGGDTNIPTILFFRCDEEHASAIMTQQS